MDWDYWESRKDPRCHNCKMHSGFEASVVRKLGGRVSDVLDDGAVAAGERAGGAARGVVRAAEAAI